VAVSPAHRFGQMVGQVLESAIEPVLRDFATKYGLFLDKKGPRPVREGAKVTWIDHYGNKHDLDFVLERGGTPEKQGTPIAFIEAAWRRYTKHSRNKAQEIQGAIMPLFETYKHYHPFKGAVLAGLFTEGSLTQLKSLGFCVAHFPYESVLQAFSAVGIDASSEEATPDKELAKKFARWKALTPSARARVSEELAKINSGEIDSFIKALHAVTMRVVKIVRILPLHGSPVEYANVQDAITFIRGYREGRESAPLVRYEVLVVYINGDKISGEFAAKDAAIEFLKPYGTEPEVAP
jgi:hypothetical protein